MPQIIEIEGDLVRVIERSVSQTTRLTDLMPFLETRPPITMFHPRSAIMTYWDESNPNAKRVTFLCEFSPGLRAITKSGRRYRLAMPWTYFIFAFETAGAITGPGANWSMYDYRVFHTNERVTSLNSRLWVAFLPNVYEDGRICFGSTGAPVDQPLSDRVDQLVNTWYMTEFNNDVIGGRSHPLPFNAAFPNPGFRPWVDATTEHGAAAWTQFPEWNGGSAPNDTVDNLISRRGIATSERLAPMTFTDAIPPIPVPATFGRIEQWLASPEITPLHRRQLLNGLQIMATEQPNAIATAEAVPNLQIMEDGGEPI